MRLNMYFCEMTFHYCSLLSAEICKLIFSKIGLHDSQILKQLTSLIRIVNKISINRFYNDSNFNFSCVYY